MHTENRITDGFFEIIQDVTTLQITITKYNEPIKITSGDRVLSIDELHSMLVHERTALFMEGC